MAPVLNKFAVVIPRAVCPHLAPKLEVYRCGRAECKVELGFFLYKLAVAWYYKSWKRPLTRSRRLAPHCAGAVNG
jgi:hypothetical protein